MKIYKTHQTLRMINKRAIWYAVKYNDVLFRLEWIDLQYLIIPHGAKPAVYAMTFVKDHHPERWFETSWLDLLVTRGLTRNEVLGQLRSTFGESSSDS